MKITSIKSHVLKYELEKELGYSQQYYKHRTAHLVEVQTDEGITGWGECFGPGNIALANKYIVEKVIQPLVIGEDPLNKEHIWQKVYNLLRDSGQRGMPIQALSGVDIALWDILGKKTKAPLYQLVGGKCNNKVPVYGYGMMLQKKSVNELVALFQEESKQIKSKNFKAMKMKIGLGPREDLKLVQAVRDSVGKDFKLMVDANHAYNLKDALYVGKGLDELDIHWFEEPVAPEDYEGYRDLKQKISTSIAVNLHLLTAQPDMPGGLFPSKSMLEFDTTENNVFITDLPKEDFSILDQVKNNNGYASVTDNVGIGINPKEDFLKEFEVNE